jgi:hypothetical protein
MTKQKMKEQIFLGKWTTDKLEQALKKASKIRGSAARIDFISKQFINTDYKELTLIGDINTPEVFVINLRGVDCFTFVDYVEAMRISRSFPAFKENLKRIRYRSGVVAFKNRNHFFTDWKESNAGFVGDITGKAGAKKTKNITKTLNKKQDGTRFLPGIPFKKRPLKYIPSDAIDGSVINNLQTGDYIGIYSEKPGLDVSHVGIIIKKQAGVFLRHASSAKKYRKVIDQNFKDYISGKAGLIILRPKD